MSIPVKFNGASGVQVRTPAQLADLAAYTSLKFYITLPEGARARRQQGGTTKQFVFYLGNKDVRTDTVVFQFVLFAVLTVVVLGLVVQ